MYSDVLYSVKNFASAMLGVLLFPPQQRSAGNRHKYNAGGTKRVGANCVGGHSHVVARDQSQQQCGRHRGGQSENHVDPSVHVVTIT